MKETIIIPVEIDESAKDVEIFKKIKNISISKTELFKYAVMMSEVKERIKESDFAQLQSLVPSFEQLFSGFISFDNDKIVNLSVDDRWKKLISEFVGIGIGIKYAHSLIDFNLNTLNKIPPAVEGKYLDYTFVKENNKYELETKGTVGKYNSNMITDIIKKKNGKPNIYLRFGTITHLVNNGESSKSKCVVVDDPPTENHNQIELSEEQILSNYLSFLTYIVDNTQYNKLKKRLNKKQIANINLKKSKFFGKYIFKNKEYLGEYFDRRLVIENINKININGFSSQNIERIFNSLTKQCGNFKYFIGIKSDIIDVINNAEINTLTETHNKIEYQESKDGIKFLDSDGIIIIKSINGSDSQIEKFFPDTIVMSRLGLYGNFINRQPHECGATCRSRDKEGQSCQKLTYRSNCHFHR